MTKVLAYDLHRVLYPIHPRISSEFEKQGFTVINYAETKEIPPCDFLLMVGLPDADSTFVKQLKRCKHKYLLCYARIPFYFNKEFGTDHSYFREFDGFYTITQPGSRLHDLLSTLGIPVYSVDINFFEFDDTKPQPLRVRNDRIVYFGRFTTLKGSDNLIYEREVLASKYDLVVYGMSWFKRLNTGGYNFAISDLKKFTLWTDDNHDITIKPKLKGYYPEEMYDINLEMIHGGLNFFGEYDLKKLEPILKLSRYAIFPYLYKPKRQRTVQGIFNQVPEYTVLEAVNYGMPVITTNEFAKNYLFCGEKTDLREVFICIDDFAEVNGKIEKYETDYMKNVIAQKNFFKSFYDNSKILQNLLYPPKPHGFVF